MALVELFRTTNVDSFPFDGKVVEIDASSSVLDAFKAMVRSVLHVVVGLLACGGRAGVLEPPLPRTRAHDSVPHALPRCDDGCGGGGCR